MRSELLVNLNAAQLFTAKEKHRKSVRNNIRSLSMPNLSDIYRNCQPHVSRFGASEIQTLLEQGQFKVGPMPFEISGIFKSRK
jgi:hypothetical protein